jgi:hypothetical protein
MVKGGGMERFKGIEINKIEIYEDWEGTKCDGCQKSFKKGEIAYDIEFDDTIRVVVCEDCFKELKKKVNI